MGARSVSSRRAACHTRAALALGTELAFVESSKRQTGARLLIVVHMAAWELVGLSGVDASICLMHDVLIERVCLGAPSTH